MRKIVAVLAMEHYNHRFWADVKSRLAPHAELQNFTDHDLETQNPSLADALKDADCIFASMITFKSHAEWLRAQVERSRATAVFAFESMPEVMALTKVGSFAPKGTGSGMPESVKKVTKLLVRGRDEDTLYGYLKLLKLMRTLLPLIPDKARDFKNWMQVYAYWLQPISDNIVSMFKLILREYFGAALEVPPLIEIPTMGLYHPDAHLDGTEYFKDIRQFFSWQAKHLRKLGIDEKHAPRVGLLFFRKHLLQERTYIDDIIRAFERKGFYTLPVFVMGVEAHIAVREWLSKAHLDFLVNTMGFGLVGGPAGSTKPGSQTKIAEELLRKLNVPYTVSHPLATQDYNQWGKVGVSPMQATVTYSIPEMDGAVAPVVLGALSKGKMTTVPDRLARLTHLAQKWVALRRKKNSEKRLAFVVYDYPPGLGKKATAALLDVPKSLFAILQRLEKEGYTVGLLPESPEALFEALDAATDPQRMHSSKAALTVTAAEFEELASEREQHKIEARWGKFAGDIAPMPDGSVFIGGLRFGNIFIGVQPRLGVQGDPMRLLFDKQNTPHHQYLAFYRWISRAFKADALIHVGMHGSAEWLPGLQLGMNRKCWSDALLGEVPHFYLYPVNNPSESALAKRRGYAVMISHITPPLARAGLYRELPVLRDMLSDYRERYSQSDPSIEEAIMQTVELLSLNNDLPRKEGEAFSDYASRLYVYLRELEHRLITHSLHTFGQAAPIETQILTVTEVLKAQGLEHTLPSLFLRAFDPQSPFKHYAHLATAARKGDAQAISLREQIDAACTTFTERAVFGKERPIEVWRNLTSTPEISRQTAEALETITHSAKALMNSLADNSHELDALVKALNGEYLPSGPGGDLIRDGLNVLPTGRNIHAIDPWRIPSELAFAKGTQIAEAIIAQHLEEHGTYPETIAEVLWGLDTIKTKGEAVATVIRLIGARPAYDGQNKISHYELIPLEELGRPRIDVLMHLSPVFRDTFGILMNHLDTLIKTAAAANEPEEMNFIKKHVSAALRQGLSFESATARLFTQAPGMYGTYVDDMIEDSAWESDNDLDALFIRRNAFTYGGARNGKKETEALEQLLGTVSRVVHQVDSVEFGISDIDHYFSTSGALKLCAEKRNPTVKAVKLNYVESFTADVKIDEVAKALRVEYRTKLLNPKWYEGMLAHGHSGAAEISNRMTYMLGWDATTKSVDDWVYQKAAEIFALDETMRERLTRLNPQAMKNIVSRLLEASGRGLWQADTETLNKLRELYADLEDRLEGIVN
ncbi:MAG: magnesium chelatase subunit H [Chloroherpetonaceae bacterium]|nr:magnesium chelatase subunit H [Chloroherpetonaceae bacterium]